MKAWEVIEKPENWCKGYYFKEADDQLCGSETAVKFCAMGAIMKAYADNLGTKCAAEEKLSIRLCPRGIVSWNDSPGRTHAEVLAVFKELDI